VSPHPSALPDPAKPGHREINNMHASMPPKQSRA
jgi:hypothetical protein